MAYRSLIGGGLLLVALGCSSAGPAGINPPPPPGPPPAPTATNAVDVRDNSFSPGTAQIDAGTTITWTWRGGNTHNVTFESGAGSSGAQTSGTHQRTFAAVGTVRYRCTIHSSSFDDGMRGSVIVQ